MSDIQAQILENLEYQRKQSERYNTELSPDELNLVVEQIGTLLGKVDRSCNLILMQPKGIPEGAIQTLQNLKVHTAQLRWFLDRAGAGAKP